MLGWIMAAWRKTPDPPVVFGVAGYTVVSVNAQGRSRHGHYKGGPLLVADGIVVVDTSPKRRRATEFYVYRGDQRLMRAAVEGLSVRIPLQVLIGAEDVPLQVPVSSSTLRTGPTEET